MKKKTSFTLLVLSFIFLELLISINSKSAEEKKENANPQIKDTKYQYKPLNPETWKELELGIKDKNFPYVIIFADKKLKEFSKKDDLNKAEMELALAKTFIPSGMGYSAIQLISSILKNKQGSSVAIQALFELEDLIKKFPIDPIEVVNELIVDIEYGNIPPEISDFVNYFKGQYYFQVGNKKWAQETFAKIKEDSYWYKKLKYSEIVNKVSEDKMDEAIDEFKATMQDLTFPEDLRKKSQHNLARLLFQKEKFDESYQLLSTLDIDPRDRGTILLERAWAKYYLRDYSKALGLLTAYEAPIFDPSRTGEAYILKMLIFKELCYYKSAFEVRKQFFSRFNSAFSTIKKRSDLRKNKELVNLAVLDQRYRELVDLLNQIKDEKKKSLEEPFKDLTYIKQIRNRYTTKISELYERINLQLEDQIRKVAIDLLDWEEQISFLDFQTKIDSLKINRDDGSGVVKEEIPHMSFDKIYWIFSGNEFWMDEIEKYIVNVESKCTAPTTGSK